jgi:hypothetical protein
MANLIYRASAEAPIPSATSVKGALLTNLEVDGNFRSLQFSLQGALAILNAATSNNIVSTLVFRDTAGNFSANSIIAESMSAGSFAGIFNGSLNGDSFGTHYGDVSGNVSGNAGTVTNGVYTTGNQTIDGTKTFSSTVIGRNSGSTDAAFSSTTSGGAFTAMWTRRGPFSSTASTTGNTYAPVFSHTYTHNSGWNGIYSTGVLNVGSATAGSFVIHHINSAGTENRSWEFKGASGDFVSPGNVTAFSDIRLKTNLQQIQNALEKVKSITGYTYTRKDTNEKQTGLLAHEVGNILPEAVVSGEKYLAVAYGNMMGLIVEAIKELDKKIEDLK